MPRKLKVFRTPIGFYDAYVAAPSRKAALAAWGSAHDLFARGVAEEVTDPEFTRQPLANPGQVIRLSRGSAAEQIAALGKTAGPRRRKSAKAPEAAAPSPRARRAKPKPRPDRAPVDRAEAELAQADARQREELAAFDKRQAALDKERGRLEKQHAGEIAKLERAAEKARERYDRAMRAWQG
ncbi:MAG TPA: hypothetical protein VF418_13040 [Sphingomonadaceae bacterium]